MRGAESRGRCQDGIVDSRYRESLLESVESAETLVSGNPKGFLSAFGLLREEIGDSHDFSFHTSHFAGFQEVTARATATATHADDHCIHLLTPLRVEKRREIHRCGGCGRHERRVSDKLPARNRRRVGCLILHWDVRLIDFCCLESAPSRGYDLSGEIFSMRKRD